MTTMLTDVQPTLADVFTAQARLRPYLAPTPLVAAPALAEALGLDVRLKLETLQPIGAFKVRGGINLVAAIEQGAEPRPAGSFAPPRPVTTVSRSPTLRGCSATRR